jgi:hypothetical protein
MEPLDIKKLNEYVNENITVFHQRRIEGLKKIKLDNLIKKNPYLFRAKNVQTAAEFVEQNLQAFLSSSEEKHFGSFLEDLAVFVASNTCNGHKSGAQGVDLEFNNDDTHYLVSIKSGPAWGNSSQHAQLERDLKNAVARVKQSGLKLKVEAVLGICYGKTRTAYSRGYLKVVGQSFWHLISGDKNLYSDIIEPVGYNARQHNEQFLQERSHVANLLALEFLTRFCDPQSGAIHWFELAKANSQNMPD